MTNALQIIREVNDQAEAFYPEAKELGEKAYRAFIGSDMNKAKQNAHRAQMTGLESIAESAQKTSDVFDYIKKQTARHEYWRKGNFGEELREQLETKLANRRNAICGKGRLDIGDKTDQEKLDRRKIHLQLIRQFIRQMVVHYEYLVSLGEGA
jgi:hypothetical protein